MSKRDSEFHDVETPTLQHYDNNAVAFFEGTINHDVTQNYAAFLNAMHSDSALDILDFGCGPGRDLKYFSDLGHKPVGLEGSVSFCEMARQFSGCEVLNQRFLDLDLPSDSFDGVFANASLFHIPSGSLLTVLRHLHEALRTDGVLFMSNPRGNSEGWSGQRFGNYMELDVVKECLTKAGFEILSHYYRPSGVPRIQQPWLAVVSRRL